MWYNYDNICYIGENMKNVKKLFKVKIVLIFIIVFVFILGNVLLFIKKDSYVDTLLYKGKTYVYLEYNMDIFTYGFNNNEYLEEDIIYPIQHDIWDIVYFNGDLFVLDTEVEEAIKYYGDDNNYEWSFILDVADYEKEFSVIISTGELKYIYDMDDMRKEEALLFDDIEKMGTLKKTSEDGFMSAIITLAYYKRQWYWRTETIDDTIDGYPEYVIKLPSTLNNKIFDLLEGE